MEDFPISFLMGRTVS